MTGSQRFADWLSRQDQPQKAIAAQLGVTESTVSRLRSGSRQPSRDLAVVIERITNRHVRVEDWCS